MPLVLYLIDGHALAYRAYYALTRGSTAGFSTSEGEPTAGVFGFTSVLLRILEQERPEYMAVAFDTGKTFRDELYPDYKATRQKMPDDLRPQMERIRQLVDAFNIPRLEMENFEADDVLGSVARRAVEEGFGVKIFTGDRDLLQLVDARIVVNLPGKTLSDAKDYFPKDVEMTLGIRPDQIVDYKALVGDKSDNIPGVTGIGEKTAVALLNQYHSLDEIYANLEQIAEATRKKLVAGKQSADLSKTLATIVTSLAVPLDYDQARLEQFSPKDIEAVFRELEFRTLFNRLKVVEQIYGKTDAYQQKQLTFFGEQKSIQVENTSPPTTRIQTQVVDTPEKLQSLVQRLQDAPRISFDTETTSTDPMRADLVGISLAVDDSQAFYIPLGHQRASSDQLAISVVMDALKKPLSDISIPKIGHNIKYDWIVCSRYGLDVEPLGFDSMIAEWLVSPDSRNLGLKNLAWVRLDTRMTSIEELIGKGKKQISMAEVPVEQAAEYAGADAAVIFRLMPLLQQELEQRKVADVFTSMEMPLVKVLAQMEMTGVKLDSTFLADMSKELGSRLGEIEQEIYQIAGTSFNLNSPQQLSEILFTRLKLTSPDRSQRTASGFFSTAAGILDNLRGSHPVIDWVLEYREFSKLKSTYLDALPLQVNPDTGRVHTSYNQTGAVTGRIASSEPNLQNIPIRTEIGRRVRRAFVADEGRCLLSVDYSQVELRIVAHISKDQAMLSAFRAGLDIHSATAAAVFGVPLEEVTKEQRRHAKAINFGLIYGMSAFGLTRSTDLTLAEAENFVKAYFQQFPGVRRYLDQVRMQAYEQGYVETLLGRRRYFPTLKTQKNQNLRSREEREAINAPIQGTAADIIKIAMLRLPSALRSAGLGGKMLLQVHDELVIECSEDELESTAVVVQQAMESAYSLTIPLLTEARFGKNWDDMKPVPRRTTGDGL